MRRLYVMSLDTLKGKVAEVCHPQIGAHFLHLINYASPENARLMHSDPAAWEALPEVQAWIAGGKHILASTSLAHSEAAEAIWHEHPDIAILPHPVFAGNEKMASKKSNAPAKKQGEADGEEVLDVERKIKRKHISALAMGVPDFDEANDTVLTLAAKASKRFPGIRLSNVL